MRSRLKLNCLAFILAVWIIDTSEAAVPVVTSVYPRDGSINGGTRITITGSNFARNQFNFGAGNEHLGSKAKLVSDVEIYDCDIHPDGTHETQITCYTKPMPVGSYTIKVSVDGEDVAEDKYCSNDYLCRFSVSWGHTPTITSVLPRTGLPGSFLDVSGNIITTKYGSNEPDEDMDMILRVYYGGQKCELREEEGDEMYGISFANNYGFFRCKAEGRYIGLSDVSFMVSNSYGRSLPSADIKHVHSNGIGIFQSFTEIAGISQHTGSQAGGTRLTLTGENFDETDSPVSVKVGNADCEVVEAVTDTTIICETPSDNTGDAHYAGDRGFYVYIQNGTTQGDSIDKDAAHVVHVDESYWAVPNKNWGDHALQMIGYFIPPYTGTYKFCTKSPSTATLYFSTDHNPDNKVQLLSGKGQSCNGRESSNQILTAGNRHYVEIHYGSSRHDSYISLVAHFMETDFSEEDTGMAEHEIQKISFRSTVTTELQHITVGAGSGSSRDDVQRIDIGGNPGRYFVLGLDGIYTLPMTMSSLTSTSVKDALELLPSITFQVEVVKEESGGNITLVITSAAPQGAISSYEGKVVGPYTDVVFNVESVTVGQSDLTTFSLTIGGVPSPNIATEATAREVEDALVTLFSVQCHSQLSKGTKITFESQESWMNGRVSDIEPFCGRYSTMNPSFIYHKGYGADDRGVPIMSSTKYLCMAYKGLAKIKYMVFQFKYKNTEGNDASSYVTYHVDNNTPEEWNYHCEDVLALINAKVSGSAFVAEYVQARKADAAFDLWVDQVTFYRSKPLPDDQMEAIKDLRMPQAQPNNAFLKTISVSGSYPTYDIELTPHDCASNLPLFQAGPGKPVDVSRSQTASPAIKGSYTISFKGDITPDPIAVSRKVETDNIVGGLSSMSVGDAVVTATGICSSFAFEIKMLRHNGNQELMEVDTTSVTGTDVTVTVETVRDGGLWFNPIMGSHLRTYHTDAPQVLAMINGVPTRCQAGANCGFTWSAGDTPTATGVSPVSGSMGETVTITGTGFSSTAAENSVVIGTTPCTVTGATTDTITCTLGNGPTGSAQVHVKVSSKGFASGALSFTFITDVSNLASGTGSVEGGSNITLSGYGFTPDAQVTVGGNPCTITSYTESEITCMTPRADSYTSTTNVNVVISQSGSSITPGQFTYDHTSASTPVISSISLTTAQVWGGQTITIQGSEFGNNKMPVTLGGQSLDVESYTDTEIVAILPALPHGSYKLRVLVDGKGYADLRTNDIPDINYVLEVTSMDPDFGSLYGGTDLLIVGQGFSTNSSDMTVSLGPHSCDITSSTSTQIQCRIHDTGVQHLISATGKHINYGVGYAWDKDPHTVNVGDYVTWTWETPSYVSDIGYSVKQTQTASDLVSLPGGFNSGPIQRVGSFTHRFTAPGTYYYWTDFMNSVETIYFRGTIRVESLKSHSKTLSVKLHGQEASHDTSGATETQSSACSPATQRLSGCSDSTVLSPESGKFNFRFLECFSPYVESVSENNGTVDTLITITGNGFGAEVCQNEITFSDAACTTESSSSSSVSFKVSSTDSPPVGVMHEFGARVSNLGWAIVAINNNLDKRFGLAPSVSRIDPSEGSKVGGTKVTIHGAGFQGGRDSISVNIDELECDVETVTYTQIECVTDCQVPDAQCNLGLMTATVLVAISGGSIPATCEGSSCEYHTSESKTANVLNIEPSSTSAATTEFTITGNGFGTDEAVISVKLGDVDCAVTAGTLTDTAVKCTSGRLPVGSNAVKVFLAGDGRAATSQTVTSDAVASVTLPAASSTNGGAKLIVTGNGFVDGDVQVLVGGKTCTEVEADLEKVSCTLPASDANAQVSITSKGVNYPTLSVTYSTTSTPDVTSINPTKGKSGDQITIQGNYFTSPASTDPKVTIGGVACAVTAHTISSITCNVGTQATGEFNVLVFVEQLGFSNDDILFEYEIGDFTISPNRGSTNGGQVVTLTGSGFLKNESSVTICDSKCVEVSVTSGEFVCKTPANPGATCDVKASVRSVNKTLADSYTYDATLVSTVTGVNPTRGGTGGGVSITITGTNFGTATGDISVSICGVTCSVTDVSTTTINCRTGPSKSSICDVEVQRNGWGLAELTNAAYEYIDVWSSPYTWGGSSPPEDGDLVVIPANQKILLDTDTALLKMLLIQGGEVVFDEATVTLHAENILITDGGILQAGTEEKPFPKPNIATITMYGHLRSKELPIYGTKTLAVREGHLNLYGTPTVYSWTRLASTANAGSTTLVLEANVDWEVGDEIVIATTGDSRSQKESEVRVIASVSGATVTITEALEYEHIGEQSTYGSRTVHFRAEVGLLTRNVKFVGDRNTNFDVEIQACPEGFNMGEFATQTCFQGRFGDELGSDQFGGCIMVHQAVKDTQVAQVHLSHVELKHVGQAFRMGRYPVHFHLNGNMDKSFVRGCTIRDSFNRAVNIHGSHNTLVEYNFIYNTMGGSFFLEDGDETGNIFQYNLAIFVRSSTSLRNDDITPAAFWATNPNNTLRHNAVAGGTHFGTWYRMHHHPDGPGFDPNICPQAVPLGEYSNNTAHSLGWFGLWIFETYLPKVGASCDSSAASEVAKFYSLTAWNCEKGAESVNGGAIQFIDFVLVNNDLAGFEGKLLMDGPHFDENDGPGVFNSLIVSTDTHIRGTKDGNGIVNPYVDGFMIKDVEFYNFDKPGKAAISWARIDGTCSFFCGGFTTHTKGLSFSSSPNRVKYDWESEGVLVDLDGTLARKANDKVVPCTGILDSNECTDSVMTHVNVKACVCSSQIKLFRFAFNNIVPSSLKGHDVVFQSEFGTSNSPYAIKRLTHKRGWVMVLMANTYYNFTFENGGQITNISYDATFSGVDAGNFIVFTQFADQKPDKFYLDGSTQIKEMSRTMLSGTVEHGDWFYDTSSKSITYAISRLSRRRRGASITLDYPTDINVKTHIFRCFHRGCEPPPQPMDVLSAPSHREYWSDASTWLNLTSSGVAPREDEDLTIPIDRWIILDIPIPRLGKLIIEGGLELANNASIEVVLEAEYIHITGRFVAGWSEAEPFEGKLRIKLNGHQRSDVFPHVSGAPPGAKFIGAFGGLQLHGKNPGITKTRLAQTASVGDRTLTVTDNVNWMAGNEILLTSTTYNAWHTETFEISSVAGNVITLNETVKHIHLSHTHTVDGSPVDLSAHVALLTRNIKVEGNEYEGSEKESFGARILVGQTFYEGEARSGFGQLSNVEFFHTGQEGFSENYDARFSLTYMDTTSTPGQIRYSFVRGCAFHNGYSTAIGAFAIDGLEIDDNTIHHTVGPGIRVESTSTQVTNNLVTLSIWPGAYLDRSEALNIEYEGAIEAIGATDLKLENNTVAGAERLGFHLPGQACSTEAANLWANNRASGALIGVGIFPLDTPADSTCTMFNGFTLWKNYDFGIYYNSRPSATLQMNVLIENGVGIFPMVIGPNVLGGSYGDKYVLIKDNIFVGKTSSFSTTNDVMSSSDDNIALSSHGRGSGTAPCGKIAFMMTTFTGGSNKAPEKTFQNIMSYNAMNGSTIVHGNLFSEYGSCGDTADNIITTNPSNEDANHPVYFHRTTLHNVESDSKIFLHEEEVSKINSADCVDMACDAKKKILIMDEDGSFLGHVGTVLPESAFQWGGDRRYGLGDERIPTAMLTGPDAQKIDVNSLAPYKGIFKHDNCTWRANWRGYDCHDNYHWRYLIIESMDADTETRRLSPVAVFNPEGYVDLINGPQDHGWCSGYTCRLRVSTFQAIVALDNPFDIFLSSSNPTKMRFILMNSKPDECVRLGIYNIKQNRLEVAVDDTVKLPKNGYIDANGRFRLRRQTTNHQYMPEVADKVNGENFLSRAESMIFWTQCGESEITITHHDVVIVSFTLPAMTNEEFFGEKIVENLAGFFDMDPKKVRIVDIVSATTSSRRRKKRQLPTMTFVVEVGDPPGEEPTVDYTAVSTKFVQQAQHGDFDEIINATVLYTGIIEPGAGNGQISTIQKAGQLLMDTPILGNVREGQLLGVQPKFKVVDDQGAVVEYLGSQSTPWVMEASIYSSSNERAQLLGNTTITFENGWANFTNLYITNRGIFTIQFNITQPPSAMNFSVMAPAILVVGRNLGPYAEMKTASRRVGHDINLEVALKDKDTNSLISDIEWAGHSWTATASLYDSSLYSGTLEGTLTTAFDLTTGKANFTDLVFSKPGKCPLHVVIQSEPTDYTVEMVVMVDLLTQQQANLAVEEAHTLELRFDIVYNNERVHFWSAQVRNYYSQSHNMRVISDSPREGSLIVTLNIEATLAGYNETLNTMCGEIQNETTFTFDNTTAAMSSYLTVDGKIYYGVSCGDIITTDPIRDSNKDDLDTVYIVIIVILSVAVISLLVLVLLYKFYFNPKAKTRGTPS